MSDIEMDGLIGPSWEIRGLEPKKPKLYLCEYGDASDDYVPTGRVEVIVREVINEHD